MRPGLHAACAWGVAVCASLASGCGVFSEVNGPSDPTRVARPEGARRQVAQQGFGPSARYAICSATGCPISTPKTRPLQPRPIVVPAQASHPSATSLNEPPRIASSASLAPPTPSAPFKAPASLEPTVTTRVLLFDNDSARLTPTHRSALRELIPTLRRAERLVIAGRTDDQGSEARNQALALARALAIRDHLLDLMPELPARIAIDAKGRCCYVAPNAHAEGRSRNRRVELVAVARHEARP
jgi:outer membrane protein OmpA-like peptidoglycan-associated protein